MKLFKAALLLSSLSTAHAFAVHRGASSPTALHGYLDDLSKELYAPADEPDIDANSDENTRARPEEVDRFGPGDWSRFTDFGDEFDGGDGQMGVAGDGKKGLEKEWVNSAQLAKSKTMSAKNAWGRSTGYAESLKDEGVEATRAQQLENWKNQQEVLAERRTHRFMTEEFDKVSGDENWRSLAKFGVQRNQDFDLDETFGAVVPGDVLDTFEFSSRVGQPSFHEFTIRNSFMGFSDFRARITDGHADYSVEPMEGSLNGRQDTPFTVRFRPQSPGVSEAYLVIDTEDDKWTYKLIGNVSM